MDEQTSMYRVNSGQMIPSDDFGDLLSRTENKCFSFLLLKLSRRLFNPGVYLLCQHLLHSLVHFSLSLRVVPAGPDERVHRHL